MKPIPSTKNNVLTFIRDKEILSIRKTNLESNSIGAADKKVLLSLIRYLNG